MRRHILLLSVIFMGLQTVSYSAPKESTSRSSSDSTDSTGKEQSGDAAGTEINSVHHRDSVEDLEVIVREESDESRVKRDAPAPDFAGIFAAQSGKINPNKMQPDGSGGSVQKLWGTRKQCISEIVRDQNGVMTHVVSTCGENTSEWDACFSGDVTIEVKKDNFSPVQIVRMDQLANFQGYLVRSAHGEWGTLVNVPHHDADMSIEFLNFQLVDGSTLSITGNHYLYRANTEGKPERILASDLKMDDRLFVSQGQSVGIRSVELQTKQGVFAPVVASDAIDHNLGLAFYANGILVDSMSTTDFDLARQIYAFASFHLINYPKAETTRMGHRPIWKEVILAMMSPFIDTHVEAKQKN